METQDWENFAIAVLLAWIAWSALYLQLLRPRGW